MRWHNSFRAGFVVFLSFVLPLTISAADENKENASASQADKPDVYKRQSLYNTVATLGAALGGGNTVTVCRLNAVTYFLQVPTGGGTVQTPRLMRQVNGLNAVPVADNIINLQFSYDCLLYTSRCV